MDWQVFHVSPLSFSSLLCLWLSTCRPTNLLIYQATRLSSHQSNRSNNLMYHLSIYLPTLSICLSICLSIYLSIYLLIYLFICLSIYPSNFFLTWKCVSAHNGVQFFGIISSESGPIMMHFFVHLTWECASPDPQAIRKTTALRLFYHLAHLHLPVWDSFSLSLLLFSLLIFSSLFFISLLRVGSWTPRFLDCMFIYM